MRKSIALFLFFALLSPVWAQGADDPGLTESRLKAVFLYKFTGFIDWPDTLKAQPSINIGVLGSEAVANELAQILPGRTVGSRPITVRSVDARDIGADLHILFIAKGESWRLTQLAQSLQARGVLITTESDGALNQGSVINFVIFERRVKFDISLESAEKSHIKLSSRLLDVANKVIGAP